LDLAAGLRQARAYWVRRDQVVWPGELPPEGELHLAAFTPEGLLTRSFPLAPDPVGLPAELRVKLPHLAGLPAFRLPPEAVAAAPEVLRGAVGVVACDRRGRAVAATALQIQGVLDDLYTFAGPLGVHFAAAGQPSLAVWAPTARAVRLVLFAGPGPAAPQQVVALRRDDAAGVWSGVWSAVGDRGWYGREYLYEVEVYVRASGRIETLRVTDPYSVALTRDSRRSVLLDLADPALAPPGWATFAKPPLAGWPDIVLYELHVRDFSALDASVPEPLRGSFRAFTLAGSTGGRHLRRLAAAGVTHVQLLPFFDFTSVREDRSRWRSPLALSQELASLPPDSREQQARLAALGDADPYNWGYDPFHYLAPEGSYAVDPEGGARIREAREMVMGLAAAGLRVVMDVVLNHTFASGLSETSVLDKIVPGYYHRLNAVGEVETSTVCANTASELAMMERLLVDTVVSWARHYRIDGFRFDLMGHHMKRNLLKVRAALDALAPAGDSEDGGARGDPIEGRSIYLYGEGWSFGEVANGARGEQAIQATLAGTGIGTFNDRLRDAVRGGGVFTGLYEQGFATGLWTAPNGLTAGSPEAQRERLLAASDAIRASLAGGLADFAFQDRQGRLLPAARIDFQHQPAGYTGLPWESVAYVDSHDNETLFDAIQLKAPAAVGLAARVRMHNLAVSLIALGQGIPFFHAGVELLRSKSGDRNSYHSGDWFNRWDPSMETHNWGVGLPPAADNRDRWELLRPLLADPALKPGKREIAAALAHFEEMLRIRKSSLLFRLPSAQEVHRRLRFWNTGPAQTPGLIAMSLEDPEGALDPEHDQIAVFWNACEDPQTFAAPWLEDAGFVLHPILKASQDPVVRTASFSRSQGVFSIPGRTTAVFWSNR
jgi:pullulanase-type alpha-1,6-glucosidase